MERGALAEERAVDRKTGGDDGGAELDVAPHEAVYDGLCFCGMLFRFDFRETPWGGG